MGTYTPATFPRRPKNSNVFTDTYYHWQLAYYRYEVHTGLYVMSSWEKIAFNLVMLSLLALCFAAVYYCLPRAAIKSLQRLAYYATGTYRMASSPIQPGPDIAQRIIHASGEAVASLGNNGIAALNASMSLTP
ncbi:uncharacterized protein RHO25_002534 [Cercospora beticola]|uniref:Uncharacterized protein n=1 Tax=Cercospora beticola TaxID=122368 RepID=A0ABZ0NEH6_CERBT|nr:hypothetical protein RHO25_002534 [Cercospora beticola]CAK1359123.1 unnamed protein product [Cercospora beticola]